MSTIEQAREVSLSLRSIFINEDVSAVQARKWADTIDALIAENVELTLANEQLGEHGKQMYAELSALKQQEPIIYQRRMRPEWRDREWFPWEICTKECAEDFERKPILNNWIYEVRRLYLAPVQHPLADAGKPIERKPLTDDEIQFVAQTVDKDWHADDVDDEWHVRFARAIEQAHGIKEQA